MRIPLALVFLAACASNGAPTSTHARPALEVEEVEGKLVVTADGELFTEYCFADGTKPYLYPVFGPGGVAMTRGWPMDERDGEAKDHPHHRSIWFAHGDVNTHDFWHGEGENGGHIVHEEFTGLRTHGSSAEIVEELRWETKKGHLLCREERRIRFDVGEDERTIDIEVTVGSNDRRLVFGDTKEGTMAVRTHPALRLQGEVARGRIVNASGDRDGDTWGKRAAWVHYSGPIDGREMGIAMFDHPDNCSHPTWWHARDYGLFAANPFGVHDFEGKPAGTGDVIVPKGETITFRYRIVFYAGERTPEELDAAFAEYAGQ